MLDKKELSDEIGNCHARATYSLEHLGNKDIANVTSYDINEIIGELEQMNSLIEKYNSN